MAELARGLRRQERLPQRPLHRSRQRIGLPSALRRVQVAADAQRPRKEPHRGPFDGREAGE